MKATIYSCFIFLMVGCDCAYDSQGFIFDSTSNQPIVNATVISLQVSKNNEQEESRDYTDTNGYFSAGYTSNGHSDCPDLKVRVEKDGYETLEFINPQPIDTFYLVRE